MKDIEASIESCSVERLRVDKDIMELITKLWWYMSSLRFKLITRGSTSSTQILVSSLQQFLLFLQASVLVPHSVECFKNTKLVKSLTVCSVTPHTSLLWCSSHQTEVTWKQSRDFYVCFSILSPQHCKQHVAVSLYILVDLNEHRIALGHIVD